MTQEELAGALFITSQHLSRIETGKRLPSLDLIIAIAQAFQIRTDDLLMEQGEDDRLFGTGLLADCPNEIRATLIKIMKAIQAILIEDYNR